MPLLAPVITTTLSAIFEVPMWELRLAYRVKFSQ
jgi:hypothetical protein